MLILKDLPTGVIVGRAVIEKREEVKDRGLRIVRKRLRYLPSSILHPRSSTGI